MLIDEENNQVKPFNFLYFHVVSVDNGFTALFKIGASTVVNFYSERGEFLRHHTYHKNITTKNDIYDQASLTHYTFAILDGCSAKNYSVYVKFCCTKSFHLNYCLAPQKRNLVYSKQLFNFARRN